jgi:localization factor PodJL
MQPDLPWNVAGIPPEAREAARAAARREGLSVGEWLTRRILRSLTEHGEAGGWHRPPEIDYRAIPDELSSRDTDEMLARVSRSENQASSAYRRIEDQLTTLAKRLEEAEKAQSENGKAMSLAATEINTATREQAQAFDQLGAHVMGLGDRLARVERSAAADGVKDAVKGLHAGLSRLADQIAENTNQSASQIAALAGNVESVAGKLNDVRSEAEHTSRALSSRIAAFDERIRSTEGASRSIADKLDRTIAGIEAARGVQASEQAEIRRQAAAIAHLSDALDTLATRITTSEPQTTGAIAQLSETLEKLSTRITASEPQTAGAIAQLSETLDRLATRITTSEAQTSGTIARVEQQIADARQGEQPFDRRLQGIEHALADIAGRLESAERSAAMSARTVEDNLRNVSMRLDAADKRHRDAIAELQTAPRPTAQPPAAPFVPPPVAAPPVAPPPPPVAAPAGPSIGAIFDLPPFPETTPAPTFAPADIPPFQASATTFEAETPFPDEPFTLATPAPTETADSYIAAARRSARAAAEAEAQPTLRGPLGGFSWGSAPSPIAEQPPARGGIARYLLVAGILIIAIAAVVAGVFLSRGLIGNPYSPPIQAPMPRLHSEVQTPPPARVEPLAPAAVTPAAPAVAPSAPSTAPGSPVIPASKAANEPVKKVEAKPPTTQPASPAKPASTLDRLTALAARGNAKAELLVGLKFLDGDGAPVNEAEAAKWLERAGNHGEAIAAYRLGTLYERGHGVPADAAKAIQWYLAAARLGNRKAMHNLAVAYAEGSGTPKDLNQAAQWFSKAATLGLADSQFNLAVLYERGMGVQQSLIDAYKWYAIAASQGDSESRNRLDVLSTQLSADERAAAQKAATQFHPQPVDRAANVPPDSSMVD